MRARSGIASEPSRAPGPRADSACLAACARVTGHSPRRHVHPASASHLRAPEVGARGDRRLRRDRDRAGRRRRRPAEAGGLHRPRIGERARRRTRPRRSLGHDPTPGHRRPRPGAGRRRRRAGRARRGARASPGRWRPIRRSRWCGRRSDGQRARELISRDGSSALILGHLSHTDQADVEDAAERIPSKLQSDELDVTVGGFAVGFNDVNDTVREDLERAELIAFPILAILLLLVFRGLVAASLPLLIGGIAVVGTFLSLRVLSRVHRDLDLRPEHHDRARAGTGGGLRPPARVALPRGAASARARAGRRTDAPSRPRAARSSSAG